jgi:hypothetical protein
MHRLKTVLEFSWNVELDFDQIKHLWRIISNCQLHRAIEMEQIILVFVSNTAGVFSKISNQRQSGTDLRQITVIRKEK